MAEGLQLSGGTASGRCKSSGAFHGSMSGEKIFGRRSQGESLWAVIVCSGGNWVWLGLIAGAMRATVEENA
jgi:hypothetical protein